MEQSFANENVINGNNETIEICMDDVVLERWVRRKSKCPNKNKWEFRKW